MTQLNTRHGLLTQNLSSLAEDTSPDVTADFIRTYDESAGAYKKVKLNELGNNRKFKVMTGGDVAHSNSTTYTQLTELSVDVKANRSYKIKWYICYVSAATTTGLKCRMTTSTGTLYGPRGSGDTTLLIANTNSTTTKYMNAIGFSSQYTLASTYSTTIPGVATLEALVSCSSDATLYFELSTEVNTSAVTAKNYSCVEYELLN